MTRIILQPMVFGHLQKKKKKKKNKKKNHLPDLGDIQRTTKGKEGYMGCSTKDFKRLFFFWLISFYLTI